MSTADENYYRFGQITYSLFISYTIPPISRYQTTGNRETLLQAAFTCKTQVLNDN
jgi:hypothetical protein